MKILPYITQIDVNIQKTDWLKIENSDDIEFIKNNYSSFYVNNGKLNDLSDIYVGDYYLVIGNDFVDVDIYTLKYVVQNYRKFINETENFLLEKGV